MLKLTEAEGLIQRETAYVLHNRPVCVRLTTSGVRVWLKGKREFYTVPYDQLFIDGQRGSVKIPARQVSEAQLQRFAKAAEKREAKLARQRPTGAEADNRLVGCVQHDCAVCQARAEADAGADL